MEHLQPPISAHLYSRWTMISFQNRCKKTGTKFCQHGRAHVDTWVYWNTRSAPNGKEKNERKKKKKKERGRTRFSGCASNPRSSAWSALRRWPRASVRCCRPSGRGRLRNSDSVDRRDLRPGQKKRNQRTWRPAATSFILSLDRSRKDSMRSPSMNPSHGSTLRSVAKLRQKLCSILPTCADRSMKLSLVDSFKWHTTVYVTNYYQK